MFDLIEKNREFKGICSKLKSKIKPRGEKTNEMKVSNLPDKEYEEMVIKMLSEQRMRWLDGMPPRWTCV